MRRVIVLLCGLLSGCGLFQSGGPDELEIRAQPAEIRMLPKIQVNRPVLEIHKVAQTVEPDGVVKAYVATVYQLLRYSESLEEIIEQLQSLHVGVYER